MYAGYTHPIHLRSQSAQLLACGIAQVEPGLVVGAKRLAGSGPGRAVGGAGDGSVKCDAESCPSHGVDDCDSGGKTGDQETRRLLLTAPRRGALCGMLQSDYRTTHTQQSQGKICMMHMMCVIHCMEHR